MAESSTDTANRLLDLLRALFAPDMSTTALGIVDGAFKICARAHQPADSHIILAGVTNIQLPNTVAANVTHVHTLFDSTPVAMRVETFKLTPQAAWTEANTNFSTFALVYNNGNGGTDTTIATANTAVAGGLGNTTANTPAAFTVTAANAAVPSGSCVQIKVTKSGASGMQLPDISFTVKSKLGQ